MDKLRIRMQKGSVMVLFAVLLPIFVFFVSVVVDLARAQAHRSYLQNIADAAALAGVNTIEHTGTARVVPDCPGNAVPVPDKETNADLEARNSIRSNTGSENPFTNIAMELKSTGTETNGAYYYCVTIEDHVPLLLARVFLPDNILPDGIPVPPIVAWAMVSNEIDPVENNVYSNLDKIGKEQIIKNFATLKEIGRNDRAEKVHQNGNNGIYFSESADGKVIRTETVVPKEVGKAGTRDGTYKYLFIDFEPDITINKKASQTDEFPFDNWDVGMDLTDKQWGWVQYYKMFGLDVNNDGIISVNGESGSRQAVINALINKFDSINTEEDALEVLNTPITNIVSFSALHVARGGIANESNIEKRREKLEAWETKQKKTSIGIQEKNIAVATGNTALEDLVARSITGHISAYDPLLVKIESEDINYKLTGNNTVFYAASARKITIKIDADNTAEKYRPLIIYYYGPEDFNGYTADNPEYGKIDDKIAGKREARLVTLELNEDFKGILFAPNSPVTIIPHGHTIRGLVIAKSYCYADETPISPNGNIYSQFGFSSGDLTFDDFDMLDLSAGVHTAKDVIITSEQAKQLK